MSESKFPTKRNIISTKIPNVTVAIKFLFDAISRKNWKE